MRKVFTLFFVMLFSVSMFATDYYLKNGWNGGDWTWKKMTQDGDNFKLENVVFGGGGVNYNTAESDQNSTWVALDNKEKFLGDAISALDTVTLVLNPTAGTITATLLGKYTEPSTPTYYMKNNWDGGDWTWREMTQDGDNFKLENVVFGGGGVNYNTKVADDGATWVAVTAFLGDEIAAMDNVDLLLTPTAEPTTITATLNSRASIRLHGAFAGENWADYGDDFSVSGDKSSASVSVTLGASTYYRFKIKRAGTQFLGKNNGGKDFGLSTTCMSVEGVGDGADALGLSTDTEGEYTFTWTYATSTLSVAFPDGGGTVAIDNTEVRAKAVKRIVNGQLVIIKNGVKYNALGAEVK